MLVSMSTPLIFNPLRSRPLLVAMLAAILLAVNASPGSAAKDKDDAQNAPPTQVRDRTAAELLRGQWRGTATNQNDKTKKATLTLGKGDFSEAAGRFNNWKISRGQARINRQGASQIILYVSSKSKGKKVEKPVTCLGRFTDDYSRWAGTFQGFTQTGTFELTRQIDSPDASAVRGRWIGQLTPAKKKRKKADPAEALVFSLNLLTGDLNAATGIVYRHDEHPAAERLAVTYYDPETRQIDLHIAFAKPERRSTKTTKTVVFQGVFDEDFTVLEGAYQADGRTDKGTFRIEKQPAT